MKLYYVMGGGMGHLSRAAAFFYTYGINTKELLLFTANPLAIDFFPEISIVIPPLELQNNQIQYSLFIKNIFNTYEIDTIYLDTFPLGIFFEIGDMAFVNTKVIYLARLLDWKKYKMQMGKLNLKFSKTYLLEDLQEEHLNFIQTNSLELEYAKLNYPPQISIDLRTYFNINNPLWLIIHSQPWQEVEDLFFYAKMEAEWQQIEVSFVIITQVQPVGSLPKNTFVFNSDSAYMYLTQADRIFTAAGFNLLQQCRDFKDKHYVMPFKRAWDLQFERARQYKK